MARLRLADVQSRRRSGWISPACPSTRFTSSFHPWRRRSRPHGDVAPRWDPPDCPPVCRGHNLPLADARRPAVLPAHVSGRRTASRRPGAPVRPGPEPSQAMESTPSSRAVGGPAHPRRCPARSLAALAQRLGVSAADAATGAPARGGARTVVAVPIARPGGPLVPMPARAAPRPPPTTLLHRPRVRAARTKTTPGKHVLLVNARLILLCLSDPLAAACLTSGEPTRRLSFLLAVGCCRSGLPRVDAPPGESPCRRSNLGARS